MKKIFTLMLALVLMLTSCGSTASSAGSDRGAEPGTSEAGEIDVRETDNKLPSSGMDTGNTSQEAPESKDTTAASDTSSAGGSGSSQISKDPILAIACDQHQKCITVYDMDKAAEDGDLDKAEVWRYSGLRTASVKYRENTVYGNVVITSSYTAGPTIIGYPSKEIIWCGGAKIAGDNPHSVEILPSGNMLSAASSGSTVRIYNNANVIKNKEAVNYETYTLMGAHGLWYDPELNYVWALGSRELVAYEVIDNGDGTESLKQLNGLGGILPSIPNGHDLTADLTDSRYLWITSLRHVVRFDKKMNKFEITYPESDALSKGGLKSFSNDPSDNFVYCFPNGGAGRPWQDSSIASWSTDTIYYARNKGENKFDIKPCVSSVSAFYKVRIFYGGYQ